MGIFLLGIIIAIIVFHGNEKEATEIVKKIAESLKEKGLNNLSPEMLSIKIFLNNIEVALLILFLSLIPFIPIAPIICLSNGLILGLVISVFYSTTNNIGLLTAAILPHGIIELPIIFYTTSLGVTIWKEINCSILNRPNSNKITFKKLSYSILFIIIPGLLVASLIESFITPLLILR